MLNLFQGLYNAVPYILSPILGNPLALAAVNVDRSASLPTQVCFTFVDVKQLFFTDCVLQIHPCGCCVSVCATHVLHSIRHVAVYPLPATGNKVLESQLAVQSESLVHPDQHCVKMH